MRKYFGVKSQDPAQRYATIASTIAQPPWLLRLPILRRLITRDTQQLTNFMIFSISLHVLASIANLAFGGYVLANMYWVADLVQWQMWTSVLVVCLSAWMIVLNITGFIGVKYKNRRLLLTYDSVLISFAVLFMLISITCWAFAQGGDKMMNVSESALKDELPADVDTDSALRRMREFNILLASGCMGCSVLALLPIALGSALCFQMRNDPRVPPEASQLRSVLLMTNSLNVIYGFVVIGYSSYALAYVLRHELETAIAALYTTWLAGLAMLIVSSVGIWTSQTKYLAVTYLYTYLNLPLLLVCIVLAIQNFWIMDRSDREVRHQYNGNDSQNVEDIQAAVKGQLLVSGILCITAALMQLIYANSARQLREEMIRGQKRREEKSKSGAPDVKDYDNAIVVEASPLGKLTKTDKYMVVWAVFTGLLHIFFTSTFVIFNRWLARSPDSWVVAIWVLYGKLDSRYVRSDDFLVTVEALLALFVGPLLLVFAWGTVVRAPFRYSLAIISCTIQIYTQVLYYATEIHSGFSHLLFSNSAIFWILFLFMNLVRVVFPCIVLWHALRASSRRIRVADMQGTCDNDADVKPADQDIEMVQPSLYSKEDDAELGGVRVAAPITPTDTAPRRRFRRARSDRPARNAAHVAFVEESKEGRGQYIRST
jgi:cholestenol delta-isomerase